METFSALLAICAGNLPVTGEFPAQRPVTRSFDVFFDLRLNKQLINNGEAGDLRRHSAHYDVTVMPGASLTTSHNTRIRFLPALMGINKVECVIGTPHPLLASQCSWENIDVTKKPQTFHNLSRLKT